MKGASQLIKEYLLDKDVKPSQLARLCGTTGQNMNKKLKLNDMDTAWVDRISTALKHDFFADLSLEWKKENTGNVVSEPAISYGKSNDPLKDYIEAVVRNALEERERKRSFPLPPPRQQVKKKHSGEIRMMNHKPRMAA